jgi:DNA topoisomerase-1
VTIDEVTLKQALPMFKLPRTVGQTKDGREIIANIGRFGPYVQVDKIFVSIKGVDPLKITEQEARRLIAHKEKVERERHIADFGKIKILKGPYGPYVTDGKINAKIPKETDPKKLTEKHAQKLLDEAPKTPKRRFRRTPTAQ